MNALTPVGTQHDRLAVALSRAGGHPGLLELRELRYFAAAARTGNLGRAAQELNVTAPAISQQLRKLEDDLGTPLLIRHARGVTPTPAGDQLLQRIETILRLLNAPLDSGRAETDFGGTVSLAVPAEIGAPLVAEVRRSWPDLTIDLHESAGGGDETRLLDGLVDIALLSDPPELDELRIEPLLTEHLGLVVTPGNALARTSQPLRLRDLTGVPLILPTSGTRLAPAGAGRVPARRSARCAKWLVPPVRRRKHTVHAGELRARTTCLTPRKIFFSLLRQVNSTTQAPYI